MSLEAWGDESPFGSVAAALSMVETELPAGWVWLLRNDEEAGYFANICAGDNSVRFPTYGSYPDGAMLGALRRLREWQTDARMGSPGQVLDGRAMPQSEVDRLNRRSLLS